MMSWDLDVAPLVQSISRLSSLCGDSVSDLCFPVILSFCAWESIMRSYSSVDTLQVHHVVRFSVSAVTSVSPVNHHVVQPFLFPT